MRFVSRVGDQKFWCLTNSHVINTALHWAEQVMVKVGNMDGLVNHQVKNLASLRMVVSYHTADGVIRLGTEGSIITLHLDGSIVIMDNKGVTSKDTRVSV